MKMNNEDLKSINSMLNSEDPEVNKLGEAILVSSINIADIELMYTIYTLSSKKILEILNEIDNLLKDSIDEFTSILVMKLICLLWANWINREPSNTVLLTRKRIRKYAEKIIDKSKEISSKKSEEYSRLNDKMYSITFTKARTFRG